MIRHARATATAAAPPEPVDPAVRRLAATVVVGALAVVFDTTITSVALNDLAADLRAPLATVQWVGTGYLLAVFTTIPLAGWAQARLGGKRLWTAALGVFLLGSLLCALAPNAPALIGARVVQGVGGGVMMPLMATLVIQAARGRGLGRVMAAVTLPTALGPILGPVLGGLILHLGNWRWLFLVNLPFCAAGAWLAHRNLPDDRPGPGTPRPRLDTVGLLLLPPGTAALLYGLSRTGTGGATLPLLAGAALLTAFTVRALRRPGALVDLRLLRHRPLASASALGFLGGVVLYGAMVLLPLYWQQVRGQDALGAGLALIPQGVGVLLARARAGVLTDRLGPRPVALGGFALTAAATVPFALGADGGLLLGAALLLRGVGLGAAMVPLGSAGYLGLDRGQVPDASVITRVAQQIGGSAGTALLIVVLQHATTATSTPADGFTTAFTWSAALTALAVPLCLLLPRRGRSA
ncbi:MDR family MFS transporter [Kitasatospora fiedleri]|uniref:MDR family MFS transporter n=1 Tax=Kitasatospora fiedleri TaxID=2991545 RepID=UPI00384A7E2E